MIIMCVCVNILERIRNIDNDVRKLGGEAYGGDSNNVERRGVLFLSKLLVPKDFGYMIGIIYY